MTSPDLQRIERIDEFCSIVQYSRSNCNYMSYGGSGMRFGVFILGDKPNHLTHQEVFANVLEEARWAEELGYDEVWLAEHHFSPYGTLADLPMVAASIAAQTERIRIGTACMVAPF